MYEIESIFWNHPVLRTVKYTNGLVLLPKEPGSCYYNQHMTQYSIQQGYNTFRSIPAKPIGTTHTSHEDDTKQTALPFYRICMQCVSVGQL
jgi:hypothetical protein